MSDYDVFISYSSKDSVLADRVVAFLEDVYIRCWVAPRDIRSGKEWAEEITTGILSCEILVLIFTRNSNESNQVSDEINQASAKKVTLLPLRIENVEPNYIISKHTSSIQWLDATTPPLEKHLKELNKQIALYLRRSEEKTPKEQRPMAKAGIPDSPTFSPKRAAILSSVATLIVVACAISASWMLGLVEFHFASSLAVANPNELHGFSLSESKDNTSHWRRLDDGSWIEDIPGHGEVLQQYIRRSVVDGCNGVEIRSTYNGYDGFIPDKSCVPMAYKIMNPPDGKWEDFGTIVTYY